MRTVRLFLLLVVAAFSQCACADNYLDATKGHDHEITPAYFGVHFHRLVLGPGETEITTQWPPLAFGTLRLWDAGTLWSSITPRAGEWDFQRLDFYVNAAAAHGATVLYTLGGTPRWASMRPDELCPYGQGCAAESVRIGHWEEYVRRVAQRYGKRIADYELWNEPNFSDIPRDRGAAGFYTGSLATMIDMARVARKVLDDYSPTARLCTPGFVNGPDRLELFLSAGGKQYVQAVCYHFYSGDADHFVRQVLEVRAIMKRNGVENLPLWNTETGVEILAPGDPPSGIAAHMRTEAVARLSQMLILGAAAGLERFDYYAWDNKRSGMVSGSGEHLFGYEEMQRLQSWLLGSRLTGCRSDSDTVQCSAEKGPDRFIFAWAKKNIEHTFVLPKGAHMAAMEPLFGDLAPSSAVPDKGVVILPAGSVPVRLLLAQQN